MQINPRVLGGTLGITVLLGSICVGAAMAKSPVPTTPPAITQSQTQHEEVNKSHKKEAPEVNEAQENEKDDQIESPSYSGSITVDQNKYEGMSEAEEAAVLQKSATITAAEAEKAALDANPGTTAKKVELDNENGVLVYSVELNNGLDVKADAGNGKILHTEQAGESE